MKIIKVNHKRYRKFENIGNIVKPGNMKDLKNLKIYKNTGKKLRVKKK